VSILLLTQMIIGQTIVDYDQTWTIDQIYDGDIIIKSGVTLTVDGARVGMKKAKSIIVENNAKLISQEGKFDYAYATSYEDSQEKWFGIKMQDGSSLEMYASTLNNAQQAIRLDGDGDILLRNNVYFNHDLTGMKLNMIDYNNSNIVVDVYCSFFDCTTGIDLFGNFEKFEVTRWVSFYNCTNAIQIYKDWDDDNGNEPLISEADFHNCDYGIYCAYSGFKVENCSFDDGETAIDIEDADGVELIHNTFNDQSFAGLASYGSNFFMHDENSFHYCNTGVLAMDSYSNSQFSITDQNYFGFCGTAIDVSGVDGAKNFEIIDNILEYNEFGIFAEGSNHFDIQVNELYTNDYNININRSGDQKNNVGCNEVSNSWNGLQIHYFNDMTDFIGNNFVDLTTDDVILRESTLNQNIGDNLYPAMNSFGPNSLDILNLNSDKFKYWIPKNAPDNLDPEGIPESWKYHSDFETTNKCELPVNIPDDIDDVTINEWKEEFCYYWEIYKYNPDNELAKELYY
ncbi:MAG TPA: hypothetical protein ENK91_13420, partial [Bacteroidetes bacterium]|nr:hypothetical protein [Bacteroidota bacterium]